MGNSRIFELKLTELSNAYIKDGVLKKYRFYSDDPESMHYKLHKKYETGDKLTGEEFDHLMSTMEDLLIMGNGNLSVFHPTKRLKRQFEEFKENIDSKFDEVRDAYFKD